MRTRTCLFRKWEALRRSLFSIPHINVNSSTNTQTTTTTTAAAAHPVRKHQESRMQGVVDIFGAPPSALPAGRIPATWSSSTCCSPSVRGVRGVARAIPVRSTRVIVGCAQSSMSTCEPVSLLLPSSVLSSSRCLHGVAQPGLRQCHSHP